MDYNSSIDISFMKTYCISYRSLIYYSNRVNCGMSRPYVKVQLVKSNFID